MTVNSTIMRDSFLRFFLILSFLFSPSVFAQTGILTPGTSSPTPDATAQVGVVAAVHGLVTIKTPPKVGRDVKSGEPIYLGDEISTDSQGHLQILLLDQTTFTIGPSSSLIIDQFVYDPANQSGDIHAKVVKGVFRFVTGKIGQKNPQKVKIDLPAGTIGIRGTMVAGNVEGKRSLVVLLGPGEKNNTAHRKGSISLSNAVNGKTQEVFVTRAGFGSTIEGEGSAPTPPFQVPVATLNQMTQSLGSAPSSDSGNSGGSSGSGGQGGKGGKGSKSDDSGGGGNKPGSGNSPTKQAGQDTAQASVSVQNVNVNSQVTDTVSDISQQAAQESIDDFHSLFEGITTFDDLTKITSGTATYSDDNVPLYDNASLQIGHYDISVSINFGTRTLGGSPDTITGQISTNPMFQFAIEQQSFGSGSGPAYFLLNDNNTDAGVCGSCSIDGALLFLNEEGQIAHAMVHSIEITDSTSTTAEGAGFAGRS